jgi:hypothetical protein
MKNEDWQRVKVGEVTPLPIDFLITLPDGSRSSLALETINDHDLSILSNGKPIGTITETGVPVTLTPHAFGPGFARLGIVETNAQAGMTPGAAEIVAELNGGTRYVAHLVVEGP